ncbi:MAG: ABC transporter substrate-binding protein [bacterium]|nr:ABC transporter substrate-binding protein [bacterium]MBU1918428.1 ABC transporter substrate-binding protein [bacterium]
MLKTALFIKCFILSLFLSLPAFASAELSYTKQTYEKMMGLETTDPAFEEKALSQFQDIFNFVAFNNRVTRDIKNKMTPEEFTKLETLFKDVFYNAYKNSILKVNDRKVIHPHYSLKENKEHYTIVNVTGQSGERQATLTFYIKPNDNKKEGFQLIDLSVEGALLSRNYRGSFNRIFREKGFAGLYARIQNKRDTLLQHKKVTH